MRQPYNKFIDHWVKLIDLLLINIKFTILQSHHSGEAMLPGLRSSVWNPPALRPSAPMWKYPFAPQMNIDNKEYDLNNFPNLSSPGRRPPISDIKLTDGSTRDHSPMLMSPGATWNVTDTSKTLDSPILIPDSPSPSVITISSSSDRSNSCDFSGMRRQLLLTSR